MGRAPLELAGMRFGRLVAIERLHALPDVGFQWRCACDCGNECIYPAKMLKLQAIQSCGCGMRAARRETRPGAHRNGATQTGEYHAWQSMLRRCDPRNAGIDRRVAYKHIYRKGSYAGLQFVD